MTPTPEVQERLRRYLLGQLDDNGREEIERDLLAKDEVFEELLVVEDEVIDEYINGKLSDVERTAVEEHFLATPERHEKLRFGRAFNRYLSSQAAAAQTSQVAAAQNVARVESISKFWIPLQNLFSSPVRIAVLAILVVGIAFGIWRIFFHQSEVDKGLVALNQAYREQRPIESRISRFDYAPYVTTRGPGDEKIDQNELRRAELTLLDAQAKNPTPAVHHALGKVYLAKKQFDDAIKQFDEALKSDPKNAQLYSDLGAAWLEKGRIAVDKGKADPSGGLAGKGMEELGRSLENLNKALELNPNLLEALFNRALCEEPMTLLRQAEAGWREYLKRDSTSPWAEEARRRLLRLEEQKNNKSQTREELQRRFVSAYESKNHDAAWSVLSSSRTRAGNLIVTKLQNEYLARFSNHDSNGAATTIDMLLYAGKIEEQRVGDRFTLDLARHYANLNAPKLEMTIRGQNLLKSAQEKYAAGEFESAIALYSDARNLFVQSGNDCEALFAESNVGYSYLRIPDVEKSASIFERLSHTFNDREYRSLLAQSLNALADAQSSRNEYSKEIAYAEQGRAVAEQIGDVETAVRCYTQLVTAYLNTGSYDASLNATITALRLSSLVASDPKLIFPLYHASALDFYLMGLYEASLDFEREALQLATAAGVPLLKSRAYERLSRICQRLTRIDQAVNNSEQALAEAGKISGKSSRTNVMAHATLNLAHIFRDSGAPKQAVEKYDQSLELYQKLPHVEAYSYEAHKGKLLALIDLGDDNAAETELNTVLGLFESYRSKIADESLRDKFFDTGQTTYDVAIDFEYSRRKNPEKAFEYAEASRARSLNDLMNAGAKTVANEQGLTLLPASQAKPLQLREIQARLPETIQLLEYAVLDGKVIAWVITRTGFSWADTAITERELNESIHSYIQVLSQTGLNHDRSVQVGKELYLKLISPLESESRLNKTRQLCIVPDKDLNFLPFAALVSDQSGQFLVQQYALVIAPSATVFIASSERAKDRDSMKSEEILSVGNPLFDRMQFKDLPGLPAARREAEQIAAFYHGIPLIGADAETGRVKNALKAADVIHFATHALADERSPLLSKLLLTKEPLKEPRTRGSDYDGFLQASEIYEMKLPRARLVVLSACQTGIERAYRGEGAIGLARPFIAAGVPLVVASLWPVESDKTAELMISFHRHRTQDHISTVEALRRAQLEIINARPRDNDYGWAAFVAIGGYTVF